MNALASPPPFPQNPQPGDTYCGWTWNGTMWVCTGSQGIVIQKFVGSGVYMPSPGLISGVSECIGGGGGGGGATATGGAATIGWITGGGGGSSGQYSKKAFAAALVRGGVNVTVGVGGAAGAPAAQGGPGGQTAFGAICMALGGNGGFGSAFVGDSTPANLQGGGGSRQDGPGQIGDVVSSGNAGLGGGALYWDPAVAGGIVTGGLGGMAFYGGAAQQARANGGQVSSGPPNGTDVGGYWGSGGGGGACGAPTLPAYGTPGGSGVCIVTEYLFSDFGGGGGCGDGGQARVAAGQQGWRYDDD
jgi:hypothetical protein